jgi:hypothetical protein
MRLAVAMRTLGVLSGLACISAAACTSGGGSAGTTATASGFGQQYCSLIQPCCAAAGLPTGETLCNAFAQAAAEKSTYDPVSGQACITGMQQESGSASFCTTLGNDIPACSHVFGASSGTVQPGQPCTGDSQCAPAPGGGATCFSADALVDGGGTTQTQTCIQTTPGKAGDSPCIGTVEGDVTVYTWSGQGAPPTQGVTCAMADGLRCSGSTQQCTPLANPGDPCTTTTDCVTSAYCAISGSGGTCTARLADGSDCVSAPSGCQTTSYCDPSSHTCMAYVAPGSACTTDQQCQYGCVNQTCAHGTNNFGLALLCG